MKPAAAATVALFSAVVSATPGGLPAGALVNCARAHANYCWAPDVILRCDGNAVGTRFMCESGSGSGSGSACRESSKLAGDAVCCNDVSPSLLAA
ncbi:hypothetical protein UVI_02060020 [Ustilaginoidea virens]|uniref:Uncharacterized protein n=1 Tax=Ustilaginoidea virens TaxID=1159556 RepID=A0A1B5L3M4_USTVR|nr:hypothetical protein UVI_02060020 [Ustilaginoidea virens]